MRGRVELLPTGPKWLSTTVTIPGYRTEDPITLYYRDSVECVKSILHCPLFAGQIKFIPTLHYTKAGTRTYGDWITSDGAWWLQVRHNSCLSNVCLIKTKRQLPLGSTVLGTTLSSDKTTLSAMTGGHVSHPLVMTLANLDAEVRMKSSFGSLTLLALLPIPKFIGVKKPLHGVLENRVTHACLDLICAPLKKVSREGTWMSDFVGDIRHCYTPLVGYIADTPKAMALTGVAGKTSHLTTAFGPHFGDDHCHPPRTSGDILSSLASLSSSINPWNLAAYTKEAKTVYRLNGVHRPFWRDWVLPTGILLDPHHMFPIEILHHFHKRFWDHDMKWCIRAVGETEIDFRFSVIQYRCGTRHFSAVSNLKQVTGREHRDLQRYILGVIAGAVPLEFIVCIRTLLDLHYLAQMPNVPTDALEEIEAALRTFHDYKKIILDSKYRVGKKNTPINHFEIPKLELLHSVVACIKWSGALSQWSADRTERSHIDLIKKPKSNTNGIEYNSQICRNLDRSEKLRLFDLATAICALEPDVGFDLDEDWASTLQTVERLGPPRATPDFFHWCPPNDRSTPAPLRTFATNTTAFHLNVKPNVSKMSLDDFSILFNIPDLPTSICDFLEHYLRDQRFVKIGGRQGSSSDPRIPFDDVKAWYSVQIQNPSSNGGLRIPQRVFAAPPSDAWPLGRYDTAIFRENIEDGPQTPGRGLDG